MRTAVLSIAAAGIALFARTRIDSHASPPLRELRTPPPAELRIVTLSFDSLAADILWIRYIQNLPDTHADPVKGQWLSRQLTAVVELDPYFRSAYLGGTVVLDVLADQPCEALRILERGIRRFPTDWRMRFQAGFICFSELSDSECSVRHLRAAADVPDGPRWLPGLVGRLLVESSRTDAAIEYLKVELARTTNPQLRERFQERLQEALLTRDLEKIRDALRTWRLRNDGRLPSSLHVLADEGLLPNFPPIDPFGGTYEIGPDGIPRSTTGRTELRAFRNDHPFYGTVTEKLTDERMFARLPEVLGHPPWILFPGDRLYAAGGRFEIVAKALQVLDDVDPDELRTKERLGLKARLVLRLDLDALQAAQLALLRREPSRRWTLTEIANEARVALKDPFGDPYRIDADGRPAAHPRRRRLLLMNEGVDGKRACR